jgi:hypothetical protein
MLSRTKLATRVFAALAIMFGVVLVVGLLNQRQSQRLWQRDPQTHESSARPLMPLGYLCSARGAVGAGEGEQVTRDMVSGR